MPAISPNAQVLQDQVTPPVNTVTPLKSSADLVRSVLVQAAGSNQNVVQVGYATTTPVMEAPFTLPSIPGKLYDLNKVVIKTATAGDKVNYIATR